MDTSCIAEQLEWSSANDKDVDLPYRLLRCRCRPMGDLFHFVARLTMKMMFMKKKEKRWIGCKVEGVAVTSQARFLVD
jgi:hypothetical protein